MEKEDLKNVVNNTTTFFDNKINNVVNVLYNYNLFQHLPENLNSTKDSQEIVIENIINYYLSEIDKLNNAEKKLKEKYHDIQEIIDYFSCVNDKKLNEKLKNKYSVIEDNGECIADDLINKLFLKDKRKLALPIKVEIIKSYCISSLIQEEDIEKVFWWIILKLSATYNFLRNNSEN